MVWRLEGEAAEQLILPNFRVPVETGLGERRGLKGLALSCRQAAIVVKLWLHFVRSRQRRTRIFVFVFSYSFSVFLRSVDALKAKQSS